MDVELFTELRLEANNSAFNGIYDDNSGEDAGVEYVDLRFTGSWGRISMGRGDGAARYAQRQDLSGTDLADNFDQRRISGLEFRDMSGSFIGLDGEHVIGQFEGARSDRLRWDAPSYGGTVFSVSFGEGRSYELGLTFDSAAEAASSSADGTSSEAASSAAISSGSGDGLRIIGAIGYIDTGESVDLDTSTTSHCHYCVEDAIAASVSAIVANGLGITVGYGKSSMTNDSHGFSGREFKDIKGIYVKPFFRMGNHAFSLSVGTNSDIDNETAALGNRGYDGGHRALSYQYNGEGGIDVYASLQQLEMEGNGGNTDGEDINVVLGGVRMTF